MTIKEYVKIYKTSPSYLIFRYVNGYFEEINGNKYLTLVPNNESQGKTKKNMKNCEVKSRELIRSITENSDDYNYDEKYIKLKLDSNNELSLNKMIKFPIIEIVARAIF